MSAALGGSSALVLETREARPKHRGSSPSERELGVHGRMRDWKTALHFAEFIFIFYMLSFHLSIPSRRMVERRA